MKKLSYLLFATVLLFASCSKDKEDEPKVQPTSLEIKVYNNNNVVSGATVQLYANQTDCLTKTNIIKSNYTDANGIASFTNLKPIQYFYRVEKDCMNNVFESNTTTNYLTANVKNTLSISISSKGNLKINNLYTNPYKLYINSVFVTNINANTYYSISNIPIGNYTIRMLQISGYLFYPTDETKTATVTCGSNTVITFQ